MLKFHTSFLEKMDLTTFNLKTVISANCFPKNIKYYKKYMFDKTFNNVTQILKTELFFYLTVMATLVSNY